MTINETIVLPATIFDVLAHDISAKHKIAQLVSFVGFEQPHAVYNSVYPRFGYVPQSVAIGETAIIWRSYHNTGTLVTRFERGGE